MVAMARKFMLKLWFASGQQCRKACDLLGLDRRRVHSLNRSWSPPDGYSNASRHWGAARVYGKWSDRIPLTHTIRFREQILEDKAKAFDGSRDAFLGALGHLDDETTW